jgi:hypothetical protein
MVNIEMAQQNSFLRRIALKVLGGLMLCHQAAYSQQDAEVQLVPNGEIAKTWQQTNPGASVPVIAHDEDGNTRLEWTGSVNYDAYTNDVSSASGNVTSGLSTGDFFRSTVSSDLRAIGMDNTVNYFQMGGTNSNDRSVLSQGQYQVSNFQVGRTGEGYMLALGDIAPNFSSLGSSLGVRGLYGQRQFGEFSLQGFTGVVAESWEALDNAVPSNQYQKEVVGFKLEKSFGPALRAYITEQLYTERLPERTAYPLTAARGTSHSDTVGFQYQQDQFMLTGEAASNNFEDDGTSNRQGQAAIVDASWRTQAVGVRAGYHDIAAQYTSLSSAAQPGVLEAYAAVDWTMNPWISLTTDLRNSKNSTLATVYYPSTFIITDAVTVRANVNFGADHPGWAASLQQTESQSVDSSSLAGSRSEISSTLNYATPAWNIGIGIGQGKDTNAAYAANDSVTDSWNLSMGRTFTDAVSDQPETWGAAINFSATSQAQRLLASDTQSVTTSYSIGMNGQRVGWGRLNLLMTGGETTQPNGAPSLRMQGIQMDAVYPFKGQNAIKLYVRSNWRNIDDAVLAVREYVTGLQFNYIF